VISVVVPVLNGLPWLEQQIDALVAQECDEEWELVVADNGSNDGTREVLDAMAIRTDRLRVVDASSRPGPGAARNAGVLAATGERLVFCDADDVVQPGWIGTLTGALDDSQADVVAGAFDFGMLNGATSGVPPSPAATGLLGFLPFGLASNLAVRRSAFEAVGGFDEQLRVGEDIDLCWRIQLQGGRFEEVLGAVVARREPEALGDVFRQALAYGRSGVRLYRRHRGAGARRAVRPAARSWLWLVVSSPGLRRSQLRRQWVRAAGVRIGRLAGSVEQRTFFP
jgi:glycosyltransferase involved in cell wall biosynthesis